MKQEAELLITQSMTTVTVRSGEVPVLLIYGIGGCVSVAAMAVNFIRSGSPRVQVVLDGPEDLHEENIQVLENILVQIGDFYVAWGKDKHSHVVEILPGKEK